MLQNYEQIKILSVPENLLVQNIKIQLHTKAAVERYDVINEEQGCTGLWNDYGTFHKVRWGLVDSLVSRKQ